MNPKQLARLAIGLAALLALWGVLALIRHAGQDTRTTLKVPRITAEQADSIIVSRATDTIRIAKGSSGGWTVNGYPAAAGSAQDFLATISDTLARSELAAESPASHARLEVDTLKGRRLRVVGGGKTLEDLIMGTRGPDFEGVYIRRASESAVYLIHGRLAELVDRRDDDWRDKLIAKIAADSVARVEITRGKKSYVLRRDGKTWTLAPGGPADSAAASALVAQFAQLTASGFPTAAQADSAKWNQSHRRVRLLDAGEKPLLALEFDSTAGGFLVRANGGGTVYRIDAFQVDQLTPVDSTLRAKPDQGTPKP